MFVRVSSHNPNQALDECGPAGSSVSLDEITPGQGTAIFVESEPSKYVYQVKSDAVRSYKRLRMVDARSARSTWKAIFSASSTVMFIALL